MEMTKESVNLSERDVYLKYRDKPGVIENKSELSILKKWALTGLVKFGANLKTRKAEARLTKRGKWKLPAIIG